MSEENEVPSEPTEEDKEWAVKLWDVLHKPGEENPRIKLARALSALRASWEKDIDKLRSDHTEYEKIINSEYAKVKALEAEKKGLEERVRELTTENGQLKAQTGRH